ncbi:MAG: amino acid ABC transporter permease [Acidisphaera sp.]|nr:amino acid ABC transporter permease [Acidisphaera sp.]
MAEIAAEAGVPFAARQRPPAKVVGPAAWARRNLFGSWWSTALTLVLGYLILRFAWGFFDWAVVHAIWTVPYDAQGHANSAPCRAQMGVGACWAVIADKYRFILFGFYPYDEQWRPLVCIALFLALYAISANRRFWRRELGLVWIVTLLLILLLMHGSETLGLTVVTDDRWGGLPLTLLLATFGLALAFPLAVAVALGRRSRTLPAVRLLCVVYVELIRGVPLISLLFMSSVMFPLFMPQGVNFDNLLRAQVAIILFAAAYLAEVVRGGLQALPKGQYEAADALGLSYGRKTRLIVLPQALRIVIPPLVNTFIGFFKDTSLVLIIGIYDLLQSGRAAVDDPVWQGFGNEVYVLLALIYFCFCFAMSKYSRGLERDFSRSRRR